MLYFQGLKIYLSVYIFIHTVKTGVLKLLNGSTRIYEQNIYIYIHITSTFTPSCKYKFRTPFQSAYQLRYFTNVLYCQQLNNRGKSILCCTVKQNWQAKMYFGCDWQYKIMQIDLLNCIQQVHSTTCWIINQSHHCGRICRVVNPDKVKTEQISSEATVNQKISRNLLKKVTNKYQGKYVTWYKIQQGRGILLETLLLDCKTITQGCSEGVEDKMCG